MSRVITFSKVFPSYHPRKGESTWFVNQIWESVKDQVDISLPPPVGLENEMGYAMLKTFNKKHHTIRAGNRWKVGDKFSPRVWSGKPYRSKQITIAPDIEVKKVWKIQLEMINEAENGYGVVATINSRIQNIPMELPKNDGLRINDFVDWFNLKLKKPFEGQIICWNENINY